MDIFLQNVPEQSTENGLKNFFRPKLSKYGIETFHCHKMRRRNCAILTVPEVEKAKQFLKEYANTNKLYLTRAIKCSESRNAPDKELLRALAKDEKDAKARTKKNNDQAISKPKPTIDQRLRSFRCESVQCGLWDYQQGEATFVAYFEHLRKSKLIFGKKRATLVIEPDKATPRASSTRVDFLNPTIESVTTGNHHLPIITFTLSQSPEMFEVPYFDYLSAQSEILLHIGQSRAKQPIEPKRLRISGIDEIHATVAGICLVYRMTLLDGSDVPLIKKLLASDPQMPPEIYWPCRTVQAQWSFAAQLDHLASLLKGQYYYLPFGVKFQVQRLVQNGYLPPGTVIELLPTIASIFLRSDTEVAVTVIRKIAKKIPYAGPDTEAKSFTIRHLKAILLEQERTIANSDAAYYYSLERRHSHIVLVHRVLITPTGTYLEGPEPEVKNRVLRMYQSQASDYFLRVSFADEDSERLHANRAVDVGLIYYSRFGKVLDGTIDIGGQLFEFLGFSNSSLREQTCWFMSPIGKDVHARAVIAAIGNFSAIRCPAKCAARIGQAFTETQKTVPIPESAVQVVEDVRRNGRNFSDGVGTFSPMLMERIWKTFSSGTLKPTLFQIRYGGAKGMVSLDRRLKGEVLRLRESMVKFPAEHGDLEICGAAYRALPFYLNRQLIKILEDLGVADGAFLQLQKDAVAQLRSTTSSPVNAARFLEHNEIGKKAQLPWLFKKLHSMNISFLEDPFLRETMEYAILASLRELKHRSRILVEQGLTLYGVMDESGILEEGQIYCSTSTRVIVGQVAITRSPALHPGDVQIVTAVDVPDSSPLNALYNCVVFSQKGVRDLASQLSGGDLDGDLYNVIIDSRLMPSLTTAAADYPRVASVDIGRAVVRKDMTDFFVNFMANDQLGRIALLHMQLADQRDEGTLHADCLKLADMHSTAVDFSKTGIPVDMKDGPRYNMYRPDFMAPGPQIKISKKRVDFVDHEEDFDDVEDDTVAALDEGAPKHKYYESEKILGKLYRAIDVRAFYAELQRQDKTLATAKWDVMGRVLAEVLRHTRLLQWHHHLEWARDVRESYESTIMDLMHTYSLHPLHPLEELEVFSGSILGKNGALPNRRQREESRNMKEAFDDAVAYTTSVILKAGESEAKAEDEALERSIACLSVALEERTSDGSERLVSFRYVAAAICLRQVDLFRERFLV